MPEHPIVIIDFTKHEVRLAPPGTVCSSHATSLYAWWKNSTYIPKPKP